MAAEPPPKLPYRLEALVWDSQHHFNQQNRYGYAGKTWKKYSEPMLMCEMCDQWFAAKEVCRPPGGSPGGWGCQPSHPRSHCCHGRSRAYRRTRSSYPSSATTDSRAGCAVPGGSRYPIRCPPSTAPNYTPTYSHQPQTSFPTHRLHPRRRQRPPPPSLPPPPAVATAAASPCSLRS